MTSHQMTIATELRTIRIGDLGRGVTEAHVRGLLVAFGPVGTYARPVDPLTKRPGNAVFVQMRDPAASSAIAGLNGSVFHDRLLSLHLQVLDSPMLQATSAPQPDGIPEPPV